MRKKTMTDANEFKPDWVSPPGDTVRDILEEKGISIEQFATTMGWASRHALGFLDGAIALTEEIAEALARHFGGTKDFWLAREKAYREDFWRRQLTHLVKAGEIAIEREEIKNPRMVEILIYEGRYGDHHIKVKEDGVTHEALIRKFAHRHPLSSVTTMRTLTTMIQAHEMLTTYGESEDVDEYEGQYDDEIEAEHDAEPAD